MIRYLADPANAVTTAGLLFSALGLDLALANRPELAVAAVLWAMLADQLDGVVAKRTPSRSAEVAAFGKALDGFADLIYGAAFPAIVIMKVSGPSSLSFVTSTALLLAGAIRLSYFDAFGLSADGRFMGLPLSYDVPLLALAFVLRPWIPSAAFPLSLEIAFLLIAALHVASIRVPATSGWTYVAISAYSTLASTILIYMSLSPV